MFFCFVFFWGVGACFKYLSYLYKLEDNVTLNFSSVFCYLTSLVSSTDRKWFCSLQTGPCRSYRADLPYLFGGNVTLNVHTRIFSLSNLQNLTQFTSNRLLLFLVVTSCTISVEYYCIYTQDFLRIFTGLNS